MLISSVFASCANTYEAIGNVGILSDRHIKDGISYKQLTTNTGGSKKEIKNSKTESINDAVKEAVSKVRGGCFITDVTIYVVDNGRYAVSGNVWGTSMSDSVPHTGPNIIASNNAGGYSQNILDSK